MKKCPYCLSENDKDAKNCKACGKYLDHEITKKVNPLALTSFILALISYPFSAVVFFLIDWLTSLNFMSVEHLTHPFLCILYFFITLIPNIPMWMSIILGFTALKQIKRTDSTRGRGLAIAGIVLGALSPLFSIVNIFLLGNYFYYGS